MTESQVDDSFRKVLRWFGDLSGLVVVVPWSTNIGNLAEDIRLGLAAAHRENRRLFLLFQYHYPWPIRRLLAKRGFARSRGLPNAVFHLEMNGVYGWRNKWLFILRNSVFTLFVWMVVAGRLIKRVTRGGEFALNDLFPNTGVTELSLPNRRRQKFNWDDVQAMQWNRFGNMDFGISLKTRSRRRLENSALQLGLPPDSWFVCLHVREGGFRSDTTSTRNCSLSNYLLAISEVTSRGGWVVRLGDPTMTPLPKLDRVIDYAHSPLRNTATDLYLISRCRMYLGVQSGPWDVAKLLNKHVVLTNCDMLSHHLGNRESLFIPRMVSYKGQGRKLSIWELVDYWYSLPELGLPGSQTSYPTSVFDVYENSPHEIQEIVAEYFDRADLEPSSGQLDISEYLRTTAKSQILNNACGYSDGFRFHLAQWSESTRCFLARSFIDPSPPTHAER